MATYLLDTSVMIDALNEKKNRRQLLKQLVSEGNTLACCAINVAEIYVGLRDKEEQKTRFFISTLRYFPITAEEAELGGFLKRSYGRGGMTLSLTDTLIAAVAMMHNLTLITDNRKDFPMEGLALYPLPN
jgi:predicted nucleic acid-binding protein